MAENQEEYIDAASVQVSNRKSSLNDLRSKFETKDPPPPFKPFVNSQKPNLTPKPLIGQKPKFGSSPASTTTDNQSSAGANKIENVGFKRNTPSASSENTRMSNAVKIPGHFSQQANAEPVKKPVPLKPVFPVRTQNDSNNNQDSKGVGKVDSVGVSSESKENKLNTETKPLVNGVASPVSGSTDSAASSTVSELKKKLALFEHKNEPVVSPKPKPNAQSKIVFRKPSNSGTSATDLTSEIQMRLKNKSALKPVKRKSTIRNADGKKFFTVEKTVLKGAGSPPEKPSKLDIDIDWDCLKDDFSTAVKGLSETDKGAHEEDEEIYEDGMSEDRPVSIIRPMSEGEEMETLKPQLPPPPADMLVPQANDWPEDWYSDGQSMQPEQPQEQAEEGDDVYEPLEDAVGEEPPPLQPKPDTPSRDAPPPPPSSRSTPKTAKQLEVEQKKQKKKEEEERKKELDKKKKANQALCKEFKKDHLKIEDLEGILPQGRIKQTTKGKGKDLTVQEDDMVEVIKMNINAKGKWIVRHAETQKVGYVDSDNVEVMESLTGKKTSVSSFGISDEGGEMYEDVGDQPVEPEDPEAIYEAI